MCYTALQFAFVVCAFPAFPEEFGIRPWPLVYAISVFIGGIANMYVFVVTLVWTTFLFISIPGVILFLFYVCLSCTFCDN